MWLPFKHWEALRVSDWTVQKIWDAVVFQKRMHLLDDELHSWKKTASPFGWGKKIETGLLCMLFKYINVRLSSATKIPNCDAQIDTSTSESPWFTWCLCHMVFLPMKNLVVKNLNSWKKMMSFNELRTSLLCHQLQHCIFSLNHSPNQKLTTTWWESQTPS